MVIGEDGSLFAFDGSTVTSLTTGGIIRWQKYVATNGNNAMTLVPAITDDGRVLISTVGPSGSFAIALSTADGAILSQLSVTPCGGSRSSPLLSPGGTVYYSETDNPSASGGTFCVDAISPDGSTYIHRAVDSDHTGRGALSPDGTTFYYYGGLSDGDLMASDAQAINNLVWTYSSFNHKFIAVGEDGTIYGSGYNSLRASLPNGTNKWTVSPTFHGNYPAVSDNILYFSSGCPTMMGAPYPPISALAIDGATGNTLWSTDISTGFVAECKGVSTQRLTVSNDTIFVPFYNLALPYPPTSGSGVAAVDKANGAVRWVFLSTGNFIPGQAVPTSDHLYLFDGREVMALAESSAATFSASASTGVLVPGHPVVVTATVLDGGAVPVSGVSVQFQVEGSSAMPLNPNGAVVYTDAAGLAAVSFSSNSLNSSVLESTIVIRVSALDFPPVRIPVFLEGEAIDHFDLTIPTQTAVGIPFAMGVHARNKYGHHLPTYPGTSGPVTVALSPYLAGTQVAGSGAFGQTSVNIVNGTGTIVAQTYNKIESIQAKASYNSIVGWSTAVVVTGPDHFIITMPTGAAAGAQFPVTITAVDASSNQVAGYTGTLALTPVIWDDVNSTASGALSVTNVNMPPAGQVVINNQTYSAGGGIRIKAYDSALGVTGYSSSMTVTTPPLTIDHYAVTAPAQVTVGLPFAMQINARDAGDLPVSYSLNRTINIQALLPPSMVAGSGSLGSSAATLVAGSTYVIVAAQTYNKIETIVLRATDDDSKTGDSANLSLTGPTFFDVGIPTAAQAGVNYQMTVVARDASSNTVTGYSGTVSLAAVQASNPGLSGAGTLGITSLNIAAGVGSTSFQTYTKAETIKLRVSDSGIGIVTVTATNTAVAAGPPASLALAANPQSTVASVPTVLTAAVKDLYSNAVQGATVTFSLLAGSGTVAAVMGALPSAVVSTDAVTGSDGQAQAFFASTNSVSSQANLLRASIGGLAADTTVYNSVLITSAGGTIGSLANPAVTVVVPPNAYGASVRLSAQSQSELSAADVALATAAFARSPNTFVTTMTARFSAELDSSPGTSPGNASQLVSLGLPFETDASSNVLVGSSLRAQSLLVPLSVLRIYRLNGATSLFEMVLDGVNLADVATRKVTAQVKDPNGLYVLGAPAFTPLSATSSGTVTTPLASGATAEVIVPFGAFAAATNLQLSVPSASGLPGLPGQKGWTGTNLAVSVNTTDNQQPIAPVTVNIGYKPADVAGLDVNLLRMVRYDAATGWTMLESTVDPVSRKVSGQTNHFSIFMVVAAAPGGDLSAGIVYPSPFRPAAGHTRIKFSRLPADAHVKVFSAAGRLLKELDADAAGDILAWDGNDLNGKALPSGVYIAVVKSGGSTRKLKFAVQR